MESLVGSGGLLWGVAGVTACLALVSAVLAGAAAGRARKAAAEARAAAEQAERVVASVIQCHREVERTQAILRAEIANLQAAAAFPVSAPMPAPTFAPAPVAPPSVVAAPRRTAAPPPPPPAPSRPPVAAPADEDATACMGAIPGRRPALAEADAEPMTELDFEEDATALVARPPVMAQPKDLFHGMPLFRVTAGVDAGQEFKMPFERFSIGRGPANRVVLADEDKASRVHAEVRYEGHRFLVRDAGSTNGTVRNGAKVNAIEPLEFGDVVTIGKTDLLFTCEGFELKDKDPHRAIAAFARLLEREPDFIPALQNLAFLLERDVARRREAEGVWKRLKQLDA